MCKKILKDCALTKKSIIIVKAERIFGCGGFSHRCTIKLRITRKQQLIIAYASILSGIQQVGIVMLLLNAYFTNTHDLLNKLMTRTQVDQCTIEGPS
jgi:hypothetical protein